MIQQYKQENIHQVKRENIRPQKPSWNHKWSRKSATGTKSSLCRDRNCQSTRCFKKATKCLYTKSLEKPRCGDDKNCQSPQFMRPEKPNNSMRLKYPATNTRKMEYTQMRDSSVKKRCNLREDRGK